MSSTLSSLAYTKLIFHASKHPHRPVNGILVGKSVGKDVKITDAIPLLHNWTSLSPMMEVGLDVATTFVAESGNGTKIVGYYQASDRVDDTALGPVGEKVASKVKAGFADAVVLVIDGTKLGSNELPLVSYTPSQTSFRTGGSVKLSTPSAIKSTNEAVKEKQAHLTFGDFDDHLEDVSIDWLRNSRCIEGLNPS